MTLLKISSDVAAVLKVFVGLSDSVTKGLSPLDTQGRLLHMQKCIQKNRPRIVKLINQLCDKIEEETKETVS